MMLQTVSCPTVGGSYVLFDQNSNYLDPFLLKMWKLLLQWWDLVNSHEPLGPIGREFLD